MQLQDLPFANGIPVAPLSPSCSLQMRFIVDGIFSLYWTLKNVKLGRQFFPTLSERPSNTQYISVCIAVCKRTGLEEGRMWKIACHAAKCATVVLPTPAPRGKKCDIGKNLRRCGWKMALLRLLFLNSPLTPGTHVLLLSEVAQQTNLFVSNVRKQYVQSFWKGNPCGGGTKANGPRFYSAAVFGYILEHIINLGLHAIYI